MKVILASINNIGMHSIEELVKQAEVVALFTVKERGNLYMDISDFEEITKKHNIPLYKISDINAKEVEETMKKLEPDLAMCMGWNQIIRRNILDIPKYGWVGSHPTRLLHAGQKPDADVSSAPGNEPIPYTIRGGFKKTAMSMFWLEPKVDVGELFAQGEVDIAEHETTASLVEKLGKVTGKMFQEHFPSVIAGNPPRIKQELENTQPYMQPIIPDENKIDLSAPIEDTYRLIRSCMYPYPNAFIELGGQRIYIEHAHLEDGVFTELRVRVGGSVYEHDSYDRNK